MRVDDRHGRNPAIEGAGARAVMRRLGAEASAVIPGRHGICRVKRQLPLNPAPMAGYGA